MAFDESVKGTSTSDRSMLMQRFSGLHEYLCMLGEHVNQIHGNLDRIEKTLDNMRSEHMMTAKSDKSSLEQLRELMVTKTDIESLFQELNDIIRGTFPPLATILEPAKEEE